jgi:hypothetical protein
VVFKLFPSSTGQDDTVDLGDALLLLSVIAYNLPEQKSSKKNFARLWTNEYYFSRPRGSAV